MLSIGCGLPASSSSRPPFKAGHLTKVIVRAVAVFCGLAAFTVILVSCSRELSSVTSVTATPNGTSLDVSWAAVAGATGYEVFLSTSPGVSPTSYTQSVAVSSTSTTLTGLTVGDTYYLVVSPTSLYGFSFGPASNVVAVNVTGTPSNPAPVITAITASPDVASVGSTVLFAATASDTDGDTLTYTWYVNGSSVAGPTADLNQYTWNASSTGSYTVKVSVTDGTTTVTAQTSYTVQ